MNYNFFRDKLTHGRNLSCFFRDKLRQGPNPSIFFRDMLRHGPNPPIFFRDTLSHGRNLSCFFRDKLPIRLAIDSWICFMDPKKSRKREGSFVVAVVRVGAADANGSPAL